MASQTRVGTPPLRGLFQESSGCQNPAQEGSDMMRASQERAPLAIGRVGTTWSLRKREGGAPSSLSFQYPVREAVRERGC